jgi:short-subunit dehydrogenase
MAAAKTTKKIALITGASSGMGAQFALQIEERYFLDEIWLVARRAEPMHDLAARFQKSKAVVLALDLTDEGDLATLEKRLRDEKPQVDFLVNNAGYGKIGPFAELGRDEQMQMIALNVSTLTYLSHAVVPYMKSGSQMIQLASSIAFSPAPYFAVYAATKSYVVSLSEALNFELKEKGIKVTAVCPGPVATEFFSVAQNNEFMRDKVGNAEPFNQSLMADAADVVRKALRDASRGNKLSVYGFAINAFVKAMPFVPKGIAMKVLSQRKSK